jgi:alkylhydroperoxidase family enzyme
MSRIAPASAPYPASIQAQLDAIMPAGVPPLWLFRVLARDERLFGRFWGGALLDRGHVSLRDREIVILRVCANHRSEYEWGVHVATFSAKAGLDEAQLCATLEPDCAAECWSERERLLLRLCDELAASTEVSEALWSSLCAAFSSEALLELLLLNGFYRTVGTLTNTLQMPLEDFAPKFPEQPAPAPVPSSVHTGSCLCAGLAYEVAGELGDFGYCHCTSCRKASGSAHAANAPVDRAHFTLTRGDELLREYESSPGKVRAFCSRCGSPLYAYLRSTPELLRLRLGSLDTPFEKKPTAHTFVSDKAAWDEIQGWLPQFPWWAPRHVLDQRGSRQPCR